MSKARKESVQELIDMLKESLKRDKEMMEMLKSVSPKKDSEKAKQQPKFNQNASLEELLGSLKDCMEDSVAAIDSVINDGAEISKTPTSATTAQDN